MSTIQLSRIVAMSEPRCVLAAAKSTLQGMDPGFAMKLVESVFQDIWDLFLGKFPGYRSCNTRFHDFQHTTDVFLATARLLHGAVLSGKSFSSHNIELIMLAALFHDVGYIQETSDLEGTGAKYTSTHVQRGIDFVKQYSATKGLSAEDAEDMEAMLLTTDLAVKINDIPFRNAEIELLAKILGTADLLGQMADRTYLEKLLYLYQEFEEGNIPGFESEFDLLAKTVQFYQFIQGRLANDLGNLTAWMFLHFKERWKMDCDPYMDGIERHMAYLQDVVQNHADHYRDFLNRDGMNDQLSRVYRNQSSAQ